MHTSPRFLHRGAPALIALALTSTLHAGDWSNSGGNSSRNGLTTEVGPEMPTLLWSGGRSSNIGWQPVTEDGRVFVVRQLSFVPSGVPNDSPVVAMDLETGAELWTVDLPYEPGEWTTWIAGVKDGHLYACRGGNGASSAAKLYALSVVDGSVLWMSDDLIDAGGYDGVVFAPDGDPVIGSFNDIWRLESSDGSTVWRAGRNCSVSSSCGVAVFGGAVYAVDGVAGGHVLERYDLASGSLQYQSPVMPGLFVQNSPMVGPDGTVYFNRVQNNPATDFLYAFTDTGTSFVQKWQVAAGFNAISEYTIGPDGSVYMMGANETIQRIDPSGGTVIDSSPLVSSGSVRMASDALGRVYVSKGANAAGRLFCFDADLTERWSVPVPNVNIGAPALGRDGTLIVAGVGNDVRAYRNPLAQDVFSISASCGGTQTLKLHEPGSAGEAYWVLGSVSGTTPGTLIGGLNLPLNQDWYFRLTLTQANGPLLVNTRGFLDAQGEAIAQFVLPAGLVAPGSPITVQHAFAVIDIGTSTASFASNASTLRIEP